MTLSNRADELAGVMRHALTVAVIGTLVAGCTGGRFGPPPDTQAPDGPHTLKTLSLAERQQAMERANVWQAIDTSSLDLIKGPILPASQRIPAQAACTFVFPDKPLGGMTPKFRCDLGRDDVVKVKYGEKNGEVFAEVAGSRLLWALGFKADVMYPSRVTCRNCPADPFATSAADWQRGSPSAVGTVVYDPAVIEREGGSKVEVPDYEGWAWPELDKLAAQPGGATRAQLDAFKLLAVFIQHSDSKPGQHELVCAEGRRGKDAKGNETCAETWLVIKDLGGSFGKATMLNTSKMKLADWDGAGVWLDARQCIGDLPRSMTGTLDNPKIGEAGRRFLAGRLARLSDRQIRDLFTVSNVMKREETIDGADGRKRPVTIDDWVRVFKRKRSEVAAARCPA
jgi:hypothetical protein